MAPSARITSDPFSGLQILDDAAFSSLGSMEDVNWEAFQPKKESAGLWPGIALAATFTVVAILLVTHVLKPAHIPVGASVLAMLFGLVFRQIFKNTPAFTKGCRWIVKKLIPVAVIALGAGLSLKALAAGSLLWLVMVVLVVALSFATAILLGKWLGISPKSALLIGAGTGICGSSAILAVAPLIKSEDDDIVISVTVINLVGLLAMAFCIVVAAFIPIDAQFFGVWTGATIHAIPTVAAAAFDHSDAAGQTATLVKLMRVAMLAPLVFGLAMTHGRKKSDGSPAADKSGNLHLFKLIPYFVWGFIALALMNTFGLLPDLHFTGESGHFFSRNTSIALPTMLTKIGKWILTLAMAAIGIQVSIGPLFKAGGKSILLAVLTWLVIVAFVISFLKITG